MRGPRRRLSPPLPGRRVGIAIEENRLRAGLGEESPQFFIGVPLADDEAPAELLEIPGKRLERAAKKLLARRAGPAVTAPPLADDVNGDDFRRSAKSGIQGAVIVEPEIPAEPMDDALHAKPAMPAMSCDGKHA